MDAGNSAKDDGEAAARPGVPLVSVVLATNRGGPFLAEALRSVSQQTHRRLELIVIDDGCPDPELIPEALTSAPGAILLRQGPAGVSVARNLGATRARGEFLVFLDDDDRWHPERLERQLESLLSSPGAVAGYCGMQSIDESGNVVAAADQVAVAGALDVARRSTGIILPNLMVRADAFRAAGGFSPGLPLAEDLDLVLSLSALGDFAFTDAVLVDYRTHAGNTTRRYRALCAAIDAVVRSHQASARTRGQAELVGAYRESLATNHRFAWWSALRAARANLRSGRAGRAIGDVAWAARFAPGGVPSALGRRLQRAR